MAKGRPAALALALGLAVTVTAACTGKRATHTSSHAPSSVVVQVGRRAISRPIKPGFLGLSLEYGAVAAYAGSQPQAINPVFVALMDALNPGGGLVLRVGGDSTDWTWWPAPGLVRPSGVSYTLTPRWTQLLGAVAKATAASVILGVNLEAGNPKLAAIEVRSLLGALGRDRVDALEIGNEPDQYGLRWYLGSNGRPVPGRPAGYGPAAYTREFALWRAALPPVALAGPASGSLAWMDKLTPVMLGETGLGQLTFHQYPLSRCVRDRHDPQYPTMARLLSRSASRDSIDKVGRVIVLTHRRGLSFRVDELNTVTCQGKAGVSDTFASALWSVDTLFEMARLGVDAVNFHIWPGAGPNQLFAFTRRGGRWSGQVRPLYYGLLFFSQAAPPGTALLAVHTSRPGAIRAWATRAPDGAMHVVVLNDSLRASRMVRVRMPISSRSAGLERLEAPAAGATQGVKLGGRSFGSATSRGTLAGPPQTSALTPTGGSYPVVVPAASAAMLTLPAGP